VSAFDAVLFDFGGVFTPSPFDILTKAALATGAPVDVVLKTCFGGYDQDTDHPWHQLERGEVSAAEALAGISAIAAESGFDIDPIAVLSSGMGSGSILREDVVQLVRDVRARGLKTAIVTNNIREYSAKWRAMMPLDELFDVVVDSCVEGVRKPNARIFEVTLQRLGDVAASCAVFVDDAPGNVAAAQSLGLHTVFVEADHRSAVEQVRTLIGL